MIKTKMILSTAILAFLLAAFLHSAWAEEKISAEDIVRKSSEIDKIPGWSARVVMRLIPKSGGERVRESNISSKQKPDTRDMQRLVQFISPADISGSNILIHEHKGTNDDIWIYLPSVKKVRRLLANSKKESFMGTDFTYTDITTPKVEEYRHTLLRREDVNGVSCFVVESVPKTEETRRDTGYSKSVNWIRFDNFVRVKSELHDLSGVLFKVMQVHSVKEVSGQAGKLLLQEVEMKNLQSGHTTILTFHNIDTGGAVSDKLFSPGRLDREK